MEIKNKTIICDIDGTIAHMTNRSPYDWSRIGEDSLDETIRNLLFTFFISGYQIIFVSGRNESCREQTQKWLDKHALNFYTGLYMRPIGNNEKDTIIKERIYEEHLKHLEIEFVLDDRDQVVKMWRSKGLKCLQVAEGNF